jgi:uncharacterized protein (TIGR00730 family)
MSVESICVYCASSSAVDAVFFDAAREVGAEIGRRGRKLVYGGADAGLMHALAQSAREHGARVEGVIPRSIHEMGLGAEWVDELVIADCLRTRKAEMERRADAFVVLPGGFGTLEELFETMTQRQLRQHGKPIVLLNTIGFFNPLLALFEDLHRTGFARDEHRSLYAVAGSPSEALDLTEFVPEPVPPKWAERGR